MILYQSIGTLASSEILASGAVGLHGENFRLGDIRRFGKEILGFGEERLGNFTVQVGIAAVLIGKGIEDTVFSGAHFNGVPAEGRRFALGQGLRRLQKFFYLFFFPRLGFQLCPNGESAHGCFLLSIGCASGSFGDRPTGLIGRSQTVAAWLLRYNWRTMSLVEQIQKDITAAMKGREEQRLSTLRMVKSALQNRQIEKMAPLDDKESQAVLTTLIKQRKESVEQFTKGGRQEMADKEAAEIVLIESYLPKAAGEADVVAGVKAVIAEMGSPTMKDMGTVMKNAMARFSGAGMRVDGKMVSEAGK